MELEKVYKRLKGGKGLHAIIAQSCFLCGATASQGLCPGCVQDLPYIQQACQGRHGSLDQVIAPLAYSYPVNVLVQELKYHRRLELAWVLGIILARAVAKVSTNLPACLVPVPLHPARYRQRGYNQATLVARALGGRLGLPVNTGLVQRVRNTRAQVDLPRSRRRINVRNAFEVLPGPAPERAVIIDDVMTTGATLEELARVLKRAGVQGVAAWTCARATPS